MSTCYFLYLDILGFRDMALHTPDRVDALLQVIDQLNAHRHPGFKVIVFSDTMLVYNVDQPLRDASEPGGNEQHQYVVMYTIEFAIDLHNRLAGSGIHFRAIVCWDEFSYKKLENIEAFHGPALIRAYESEKSIPCTGLFLETSISWANIFYPSTPFDEQYDFVFLSHSIDLERHLGATVEWPIESGHLLLWDTDLAWGIERDIAYLQELHALMRDAPAPQVRAKALATWDFYAQRHPSLISILERTNFDLEALAVGVDWEVIRSARIGELTNRGLVSLGGH